MGASSRVGILHIMAHRNAQKVATVSDSLDRVAELRAALEASDELHSLASGLVGSRFQAILLHSCPASCTVGS